MAVLIMLSVMAGCKSEPKSSRITIEDYVEMAGAMAQSLRQSDAIAERSAGSAPWVVSFEKVQNLSSEIMPRGEQWYVVAQVRNAQPINTMWDDKRIAFVIPAEHAINQRGTLDAERADKGFGSERGVTHTITATFRSITRAGSDGQARTDLYACEFQLLELNTNVPVWLDTFEFKREARGSIRD